MRRLRACVEAWPEAETGSYDPRCCRFPKSCSATVYTPGLVAESDLEPRPKTPWPVCDSRGPRIGDDGVPRCRRPAGHLGLHRPAPEDGWGSLVAWGDLLREARRFREQIGWDHLDAAPCRCHQNFAAIAPRHDGHCCFWPSTQTCHRLQVAQWEVERERRARLPGRRAR